MVSIILPTYDLVEECAAYDAVFDFLPRGVLDVIRFSIIDRSFYQRHRNLYGRNKPGGLVGSILSEFEQHISGDAEGEEPARREEIMRSYLSRVAEIELIVSSIDEMTAQLMHGLLQSRLYDVVGEGYWHGKDLIVQIRRF